MDDCCYRIISYDSTHQLSFRLYPAAQSPSKGCLVFFFGGGWRNGSLEHFHHQALHFAAAGYDCVCGDYRVPARYPGVTPFDCYRDTNVLLRTLWQGIGDFLPDPKRIVLCGGSAGGHLALCNAILDPEIKPAALLLFNPVVDTTETGFRPGVPLFGGRAEQLSPLHCLREPLPPCFIAHGDADQAVSIQNVLDFARKARELGSEVQLRIFPGRGHGFFNHPEFLKTAQVEDYLEVQGCADKFLNSVL